MMFESEENVQEVMSDTDITSFEEGTTNMYVSVYGGADIKEASRNNRKLCDKILKGNIPSLSRFDNGRMQKKNDTFSLPMSIIETWLVACTNRSKAHLEESYFFRRRSMTIRIPELVSSAAATAMAFWAAGTGEETSLSVRLSVAVLSCTSTILQGTESFLDYSGLETSHNIASNDYGRLCRKIEVHIFTPNHLKPNIQLFMEEVSLTYSHILSTSPPLNSKRMCDKNILV